MGWMGRLDVERRFLIKKRIASVQEVYEQVLGA